MVDKQDGEFGVGEMKGGEIKDNAKVGGVINEGSTHKAKTNFKSSVGAVAGNVKGNQINIFTSTYIYATLIPCATKLIKFDTEFTEKKINNNLTTWQKSQDLTNSLIRCNQTFQFKFFTFLLTLAEKSVKISNRQKFSNSIDEKYYYYYLGKSHIINLQKNARIAEISSNYNKDIAENNSTADILRDALKHFDRMINEFVNSVAFDFNLQHDVPLSYLESSLPNNYLLSPTISYPEKPEFKIQYPSANGQQPLVTVEPNLSEIFWNLGGMKSDLELGMEPENPASLEPQKKDKSPLSNEEFRRDLDTRVPVKGETTISLAELQVQRAYAYLAKGLMERAIAECERAITMKPELVEAYLIMGQAFTEKGEWKEATDCYQKVMELDGNLAGTPPKEVGGKIEIWEVYNRLGDWLVEVGQIEEAVEAYRRAIELAE